MIEFIYLFFPAMLSLLIYENILKEKIDIAKKIELYFSFNAIINFVTYTCLRFFMDVIFIEKNTAATIKYLFFALLISIVCPIIFAVLKNNIRLNIKFLEVKNEKK